MWTDLIKEDALKLWQFTANRLRWAIHQTSYDVNVACTLSLVYKNTEQTMKQAIISKSLGQGLIVKWRN